MRKEFDNHVLLARHVVHGSLWLAPDHLLVIETTSFLLAFRERYRRIDYDAVQGVFVARTLRSLAITILCLVFILILGGLAALIALTSSLQAVATVFALLAGMVAEVENSQEIQMEGTMTMIRNLAHFPDGFPRGLAVAFLACALLTAAFGLLGIATTLGQRRRLRRIEPPPPADQPPPPAASPETAGPPLADG